MASSPVAAALSWSLCQMCSYCSAPFSNKCTCNKYSLFAALEARVTELETWLCTLEKPVASQALINAAAKGSVGTVSSPPGTQDGWVTVRSTNNPSASKFR